MKKAKTAIITNTSASFISTLLSTKETTNPIASTRVLLFLLRRKEDLKISRLIWIDRKKLQCVQIVKGLLSEKENRSLPTSLFRV